MSLSYDFNGKKHQISDDELQCVRTTHTWQSYAYGPNIIRRPTLKWVPTPKELEAIKSGTYCITELSMMCDVNETTISRYVRRNGIVVANFYKPWTAWELALVDEGMSTRELAKATGRTHDACKSIRYDRRMKMAS